MQCTNQIDSNEGKKTIFRTPKTQWCNECEESLYEWKRSEDFSCRIQKLIQWNQSESTDLKKIVMSAGENYSKYTAKANDTMNKNVCHWNLVFWFLIKYKLISVKCHQMNWLTCFLSEITCFLKLTKFDHSLKCFKKCVFAGNWIYIISNEYLIWLTSYRLFRYLWYYIVLILY